MVVNAEHAEWYAPASRERANIVSSLVDGIMVIEGKVTVASARERYSYNGYC